jgi:hypothetical protein
LVFAGKHTCALPLPGLGPLCLEVAETIGSSATFSQGSVAASTLGRCRTGITRGLLLRPLRALGARHLSNDELTRSDLLPDVIELGLARVGLSLLGSALHRQSVAGAALDAWYRERDAGLFS